MISLARFTFRSWFVALIVSSGLIVATTASAQTVLRVGITASDVPLTAGQPDQGLEGMFVVGLNLYDALVNWDLLSRSDRMASLRPGLATEWRVDPRDSKNWIFTLRRDATFHDGSAFDADAVIWNFEKIFNNKAPQYDAKQAGLVRGRIPSMVGYRKLDQYRVELQTDAPDAFLPYQITWVLFSSPAQFEKVGRDWDKFAREPSGTGPWKLARLIPRERLEMEKNAKYWDKKRVPKLDRLVILPIPEASTRTAALRAGQIDWAEFPATDAIPSLKQAGFTITQNTYPHLWMYQFSMLDGSPVKDVRVRRALNLGINRDALKVLLGGYAQPAAGLLPNTSPWFGKPKFQVKYDPASARKLLAEAGFSSGKPLTIKVLMSATGSGQMEAQSMNEFIQQNFADIGVKVEFDAVDWNTLNARWRGGARLPVNRGLAAVQTNMMTSDPFHAFIRIVESRRAAPKGVNWGEYNSSEMDALIAKAQTTFEPAKLNQILSAIHEKIVDDAVFLFAVHDVNPRALSPKVKNFVPAQSWFQDFSQITLQ